jgi:hypothetical protein
VNVTFAPVFQFALLRVTVVGECVIAVLPERAMATVTGLLGDALRRTEDVPVVPPARVTVDGTQLIEGVVVVPSVKGTDALVPLSEGEPLSNAVACAV